MDLKAHVRLDIVPSGFTHVELANDLFQGTQMKGEPTKKCRPCSGGKSASNLIPSPLIKTAAILDF